MTGKCRHYSLSLKKGPFKILDIKFRQYPETKAFQSIGCNSCCNISVLFVGLSVIIKRRRIIWLFILRRISIVKISTAVIRTFHGLS